MEATPEFLASQLDCVFQDIFPDAVKIGMVSSAPLIKVIAAKLKEYQARHIVVDPVMVATSGGGLLADDAADTLIRELIPLAQVITPNIPEGEVLCGFSIETPEDMERAAKDIAGKAGTAVLLKGGHELNDANDLLCEQGSCRWFRGERIDNPNTHGTGCTLSSAIACGLVKGLPLRDSVKEAKNYISGALRSGLDLGAGSGPLNHIFML